MTASTPPSTAGLTTDTDRAARGTERPSAARAALVLLGVIVVAVGLNTAIAAVARHDGSAFAPLTLPVYGAFTVVGVLAGWLGWRIVQRRAARPRTALRVLVPAATLVSFVPDVSLLIGRFIPGTSTGAVLGLMTMHLVIVAVAVPGYLIASHRPA